MSPDAPRRKERRKRERRAFSQYMRFVDDRTGELVGDLVDISANGFRLEGSKSITPNTEVYFRVDVPAEVSQKTVIAFVARCLWCKKHPVDLRLFESGFEISRMDPGDRGTFERIFEHYGTKSSGTNTGNDYLWRD